MTKLKLLTLILTAIILFPLSCLAKAPIAIYNSNTNIDAYQSQHLGTYKDDLSSFYQVLDHSNLSYDEITTLVNSDNTPVYTNYKVIILPMLVDIDDKDVDILKTYINNGGHVLSFGNGGTLSVQAAKLDEFLGVKVQKLVTPNSSFNLIINQSTDTTKYKFPVGSSFCMVNSINNSKTLAQFINFDNKNSNTPAIIAANQSAYMAWSVGLQGEISNNAHLLEETLQFISPGIKQEASTQISFADYQQINQELAYLQTRTQETIKTAKQADLAVPINNIDEKYAQAIEYVSKFNEAYHQRQFYEAHKNLKLARQTFARAFAEAMPVRPIEARCVWLDRGTIVSVANQEDMAKLFDRLASANINCVYFETNNAGYTMYPSKYAVQNPNIHGFDALKAACAEAHKHNIEIHAWFWIFNVGNTLHNKLVGQPIHYPGPVLTTHDLLWGLASATGSLLPPRQHEFWIDPSYDETRNYVKSLITEVVTNYNVDGIQLDYIRYPFNGRNTEMGYNYYSRKKLEADTGVNLDNLDENSLAIWQAWKINNVSSFVSEISSHVRKIKPNLRISAAVYALPRRMRLNAIQQEWEVWAKNGWVDTLNPMTYVLKASELTNMAKYVREETSDQALVYPGLSIRQLDVASLIEQIDGARLVGTLGTTMFAVAQLDNDKINLLKVGPYRKPSQLTPQSNPVLASKILYNDFNNMVYRYLQDPKKHIMSDQVSTNKILYNINQIHTKINLLEPNSNSTKITETLNEIKTLQDQVSNWLRLEAFIQRGFRAQYIANYLTQVSSILSYANQKAKRQENLLTDNTNYTNSTNNIKIKTLY